MSEFSVGPGVSSTACDDQLIVLPDEMPAWNGVPDWVLCRAKDKNQIWWGYSQEPYLCFKSEGWALDGDGVERFYIGTFADGTPWHESLEHRQPIEMATRSATCST